MYCLVWMYGPVYFVYMLCMDVFGEKDLYLPVTGGRYLLTDHNCHDQTGHNNFEVQEGKASRFFVLFFGSKAISIFVCQSSHTHVNYLIGETKKLSMIVQMEKVEISQFSVVVDHGYLQQAGFGRRGHHCLPYHTYLIPEGFDLKAVVVLAYCPGFSVRKRAATGK